MTFQLEDKNDSFCDANDLLKNLLCFGAQIAQRKNWITVGQTFELTQNSQICLSSSCKKVDWDNTEKDSWMIWQISFLETYIKFSSWWCRSCHPAQKEKTRYWKNPFVSLSIKYV